MSRPVITCLMGFPAMLRMRRVILLTVLLAGAGALETRAQVAATAALALDTRAQVPEPTAFFGFRMGTDGRLANWPEIQRYFETVAAASDRVELVNAGPTTDGRRMIAAIVSAPENIAQLSAIQAANRRLADPRTITLDEARALSASHKVVVAIGCSIHATEVGATQTANELLFTLATATDPQTLAILRNVVVVLFPSLNPDGHALVTEWHQRTQGTQFEGAPMPWLYHKYVGHDINRDAFMMNMPENRNLARFFYSEWHPQVFLTLHQMGTRGPRFFVPPNYEPIDANYDPLIWREAGLLGHAMALALEREDKSGVVSNALFDYYWPGYEDSAPLGHNTVCLLTEVASARLAAPINVPREELTGSPRGLPEYRPQVNFPNPWPGGLWRLRDIVDYEMIAVRGLLDGASRYREELVANFYTMGRRAVEHGRAGGPFAFVIPPEQHDQHAAARLLNLLIGAGIEVYRAEEPFRAGGKDYAPGARIILMAQPFRAYAKTLLERQDYPARRSAPDARPEPPYDVAGWTLPYQMGVEVVRAETYFEVPTMSRVSVARIEPAQVWGERRPGFYVLDGRGNVGAIAVNRLRAAGADVSWTTQPIDVQGYAYPSGSLVVKHSKQAQTAIEKLAVEVGVRATGIRGRQPATLQPLGRARVALYKPWVENIDEGWTRWLLERYEFPFTTVADDAIRRGNLRGSFDAIILPAATPERLIAGHPAGSMPAEYVGGLGEQGVAALRAFVEAGGTLICLDVSGRLAIDAFGLPLRDVTRDGGSRDLLIPGSILRLRLDPAQPLAFGMPAETSAFFAYSSAYAPASGTERMGQPAGASVPTTQIVARYGQDDLLMSGWVEGGDVIAGRAAVIEAKVGTGRVVLIGFRAQHRAQSDATFRLLFNAVLTANGPPGAKGSADH